MVPAPAPPSDQTGPDAHAAPARPSDPVADLADPADAADLADPAALAAARALRDRLAATSAALGRRDPAAAHPGEAVVVVGAVGRGGAAVLAAAGGAWLARRVPPADLVQAHGWPDGTGWDVDAAMVIAAAIGAVGAAVALGDGGLTRAAQAVADASRVTVALDAGAVPLHAGTARLCDALDLNPLDLQSSGSLLLTATDRIAKSAVAALAAAGYDAAIVGRVGSLGVDGAPDEPAVVLVMGGTRRVLSAGVDGVATVLPPCDRLA
ncbi:MAG: AIR synthase-related protein [Ardenticatenales bacterium]